MHLWAVGVGVRELGADAIVSALRDQSRRFRLLEAVPSWTFSPRPGVVAAGVYTSSPAAGARRYVAVNTAGVIFYSGLAVDPRGTVKAHRADALAGRWADLHGSLEGRFCIASVPRSGPVAVEVMLDPLGLEQVFTAEFDGGTIISNSVGVFDRIGVDQALDPLGLSLLVSVGWVGADRTLRAAVRVIDGGQIVRWDVAGGAPAAQHYYARRDLATRQRRALTGPKLEQLAAHLRALVSTVHDQLGELECPLTGGRDSRLLAGLLIADAIPATYYTAGNPHSSDSTVAQQLATEFGLPHHQIVETDEDVIESWDTAARQFVDVTDGLASLKDRGGRPVHVDRLLMQLHGFGGEIARSFYTGPRDVLALRRPDALAALPDRWVSTHGGLVTGDGRQLARQSIAAFVAACADDGVPAPDVPDHFYTFDRVRRWGGANLRTRADQVDHVLPLCTRAFVAAAFTLRPMARYGERLHYDLLGKLEPRLRTIPFADRPTWRPQSRLGAIAAAVRSGVETRVQTRGNKARPPSKRPAFRKADWLEAALGQIRQTTLEVTDAAFWHVVDRGRLEALLAGPPADRHAHWRPLLDTATAAYYAQR